MITRKQRLILECARLAAQSGNHAAAVRAYHRAAKLAARNALDRKKRAASRLAIAAILAETAIGTPDFAPRAAAWKAAHALVDDLGAWLQVSWRTWRGPRSVVGHQLW